MRSTQHVFSTAWAQFDIAALRIALGTVLTIITLAGAQTLELDSAPEPPQLTQPTWAASRMQELERDAAAISARDTPSSAPARQARMASIHCRSLAADLYAAGDRAGARGSAMILAAMKLTDALDAIDGSLAKLIDQPNDAATSGLRDFNRIAANWVQQHSWSEDLIALDAELQTTLSPLADCIAALEGQPVVSHWPRLAKSLHEDADLPTLAELRERINTTFISESVRSHLLLMHDFLQRGEQFAELRPRVNEYASVLNAILNHGHAIAQTDWIDARVREHWHSQIDDAVQSFKTLPTRQQAIAQINAWAGIDAVIHRLNSLARRDPEIKKLASALFNLDSPPIAPEKFSIVAGALEQMIEYRDLEQSGLHRDLRVIDRELHASYRAAEDALLKRLIDSPGSSWSLADPEFASLITEQRQLVADLKRLREFPQWMRALNAIDPNAAKGFEKQAVKFAKGLADPNERPGSVASISQFETQLQRFVELPFELQLKSSTPAAVELTGGLHVELLGTIGETRREWAREWADDGGSGTSAQRMQGLYRLTLAMSELAMIALTNPSSSLLNRWGAWHADPAFIEQPARELASRLKLATASAIAKEHETLAQQLARIDRDAPLVRLAGRLTRLLADDLRQLPDGALATLGGMTRPPSPPDFMARHREALAHVCRFAVEERHARQANQQEAADRIRDYVNAQAERLLREIEDIESPASGTRE